MLYWIRVENIRISPRKEGSNLETQHLEVRHLSRPPLFSLGFSNPILKPTFFLCVWPPLQCQRGWVSCSHKMHYTTMCSWWCSNGIYTSTLIHMHNLITIMKGLPLYPGKLPWVLKIITHMLTILFYFVHVATTIKHNSCILLW
jgi:hypothetical protein